MQALYKLEVMYYNNKRRFSIEVIAKNTTFD